MKLKLNGLRSYCSIRLSGFKRAGFNVKKIPAYFSIIIDTNLIKQRTKEKSRSPENAVCESCSRLLNMGANPLGCGNPDCILEKMKGGKNGKNN